MTWSHKACYLLLLSLLCVSIRGFDEHVCTHDQVEQDIKFHDVDEDMSSLLEGRNLQSSDYTNIRIYPYFGFIEETAPSDYAAYISNELVPPIVDYFQAALKVKYPVSGNLVVSSSSICERSTPDILRTGGVAADFFIYYDSYTESGSQLATTKYCYLASGSKRPLVTRTRINRNQLTLPKGDVLAHEKNMYVIMHEMTHGFGFSSSTYRYFIDATGNTLSNHVNSVSIGGSTHTVLDVAPLTQKLRDFYGCSSVPGAILENGGGSATDASHFERKYFVYEYMSSGSIYGRRISQFSLALLEGSGWYVPDYTYAEPFWYGQGQGCDFINSKCSSSSSQFDEFCTGSTRGCAANGIGGGSCSSDSIMDGCKFIRPSEDYLCENANGADYARLPDLQVFGKGAGSKCFTGTLNTRSSQSLTSFCFKYACNGSGSDTTLDVYLGNDKVTCTQAGAQTIDGYYGSVNCPDPLTFCNTAGATYCNKNCMGRGTCVNGQCQCNSGYSGTDCSLSPTSLNY